MEMNYINEMVAEKSTAAARSEALACRRQSGNWRFPREYFLAKPLRHLPAGHQVKLAFNLHQ